MYAWGMGVLVGGSIAVFAEVLYIILQRPSYYKTMLTICLCSLLLWMCGYMVELENIAIGDCNAALSGTRMTYLGKPFVSLSIFFFLMRYSGISVPKWISAVLTALHTFIAVTAFTCTQHKMFYTSVALDTARQSLVLGHGWVYFIYMGLIFMYGVINTVLVVRNFRNATDRSARHRAILLFLLVFFAVAGYIVFLFGYNDGFDMTVLGTLMSAMVLFVLFVKYRMFDELTFAKDQMLDDLADGFIVENAHRKVEYTNAMAERLFPDITVEAFQRVVLDNLSEMAAEKKLIFDADRVYSVAEEKIENLGFNYGRVFELHDISTQYNYTICLQKEVEEKTEHIHDIQEKVTENFAALVEARDNVTAEHIAHASNYVHTLCEELIHRKLFPETVTEPFVRTLEHVAPLHDIGKISMSDFILKKPGRLTKDEFDAMKTHTTKGADIVVQTFSGLESEQYVHMGQEVAKYHHERWDGTGYPDGLSGMAIPLSAQIVAICDVYDALRSVRPYKDAFTKEQSLKIIAEERGKQFNPVITDVFLDVAKSF